MNIIQRIIRKLIAEKKLTDNFYHESGHVLLIKIFDETLSMEYVTLDFATTKKNDSQSFGGVKGKFVKPVTKLTVYDHDKAILAMLAGLCVDELVINNRIINDRFYNLENWAKKLGKPKYEGDLELAAKYFYHMKDSISLTWGQYITSCLRTLFCLFDDDLIWNVVISIRNALYDSTNHTLTSSEIDNILISNSFNNWKVKNKSSIIEERERIISKDGRPPH